MDETVERMVERSIEQFGVEKVGVVRVVEGGEGRWGEVSREEWPGKVVSAFALYEICCGWKCWR